MSNKWWRQTSTPDMDEETKKKAFDSLYESMEEAIEEDVGKEKLVRLANFKQKSAVEALRNWSNSPHTEGEIVNVQKETG